MPSNRKATHREVLKVLEHKVHFLSASSCLTFRHVREHSFRKPRRRLVDDAYRVIRQRDDAVRFKT